MKVIPQSAPPIAQSGQSSSSQDARARAIAALTGNPVQNQNNISPEESSVVRQQGQKADSEAAQHNEDTEVIQGEGAQEDSTDQESSKKDALSSQYALLARKEKALRAKVQQQEQALRAKEQAILDKEKALAAKEQEYQSQYISKQRLKENSFDALAEAGVDYEYLTQQLLNQQNPQDPRITAHIAKLEAKLAALEEQSTKSQKSFEERQDQEYRAAINQIKADVTDLVNDDPAYETIKHTGSVKEVVDLIESVYKEEGRVLSNKEAADLVEKELEERMYKVLSRTEKLKKRLSAPVATENKAQTQTPNQPKQPQPMKTLTNATSSTRQLSAKERAILAFKGELGKG